MWLGEYTWLNVFGIFLQATFIQNILLSNFLGMCSYLACSGRVSTANGLGMSVALVLTVTGSINWFVHAFITGPKALTWLSPALANVNLNFLELIIFIVVIAAFTQILELFLEKVSRNLYLSLGIFLPLIAVNCAILGGVLFGITRNYPFIPMMIFSLGAGCGWWLAIVLFATIKEKLAYSDIPKNLQGMGISFITTGLIAMAFMSLTGIDISKPSTTVEAAHVLEDQKVSSAEVNEVKPIKKVRSAPQRTGKTKTINTKKGKLQ
ncbi:NADH:ubiquinone reductase (Na(+)-transporting) subunit E [Chlamydia abortus]|uniref:Na(+)-translocating NADH-quinone reductase subunit E n=1 Tax=Chlamydia abortus (strain DSM 27085 / S26/3) TaxID=218497 RepID=Q5L6C3_CHLAB|nr:NADH:ubiquinone reductase (Na(+)-transporting) subunit E [Chlamydia abortus]ASD30523.1 NADH:ubiquinone reductase (Na(+)-transporting) subunit E [Chlamydia abortus]AUS59806.1 Na(+)-translocating NADH-quinone reductase subunit e [Chlamydia abortus]QEM73721.1 NADH:ubiquinone reductase (Na(+)-transporting) subunit E [Chlamydia abortus]QRR32046.1 NADH:ubiquinone reductase (Na(+)-transporting) subunit E [Chlamydia abortus]CAH63803.1 Na+-translocating NADH-quinone reductase subunit E [Chlamydia ab